MGGWESAKKIIVQRDMDRMVDSYAFKPNSPSFFIYVAAKFYYSSSIVVLLGFKP